VPFTGKQLPFVKLQKEVSKYSLQSMVVNYIETRTGREPVFDPDHIDFSKLMQYEVPVYTGVSEFAPIIDIILVGKLSKFHDPRRVTLDIAERQKIIPTELYTEDSTSKSMLDLMKLIWKGDKLLDTFVGATWWTKLPFPFLQNWVGLITSTLPTLHINILGPLLDAYLHNEYIDIPTVEPIIDANWISQHQKMNSFFWKDKLKKREKSARKGARTPIGRMRALPEEENPFLQLNMDENLLLVEDYYKEKTKSFVEFDTEVTLHRQYDIGEMMGLVQNMEEPDFTFYQQSQSVEEDMEEVENEDDLLAAYLDSVEQPWDQEENLEDQ